ncbi:uncharacterized protein A4U43_C01F29650 [Asparagus officinalis]|uniref:Uncharacterized protein n=1 Tax=Asparagus officinalis TaxID=4686 RepID=A0A5P1FVI3_ASPOF|nr:uncharacterized protein A4U43_C01F29650 [Asparagus officinalis]
MDNILLQHISFSGNHFMYVHEEVGGMISVNAFFFLSFVTHSGDFELFKLPYGSHAYFVARIDNRSVNVLAHVLICLQSYEYLHMAIFLCQEFCIVGEETLFF